MNLRLFAPAPTGHIRGHVLDLALAREHHVTAFVRSPGKIPSGAAA